MTKQEFEDWKDENRGDFGALISLANDEGFEELFNDLISTDDVDDFVRDRLDNGSWQGVAYCISDIIESMSDSYYEIDGYGNLTTCSSWDSYADELENEMDFDEIICDCCGEYSDCVQDYYEWYGEKQGEEYGIDEDKKVYTEDLFEKGLKFLQKSSVWSSFEDYCEDCFDNLVEIIKEWDGTDEGVEKLDDDYENED